MINAGDGNLKLFALEIIRRTEANAKNKAKKLDSGRGSGGAMRIRLAILAALLLVATDLRTEAACQCQCVAGTMTSVCANAMMDQPVACAPTPCRASQPTSSQQPSTATNPATGAKGKCREERVCDFYGTCRMERVCN